MNRTEQIEKLRRKNKQLHEEVSRLRRLCASQKLTISRWGRPSDSVRLARLESKSGIQVTLPIDGLSELQKQKADLIEQVCAKAGGYSVEQIRSRHRTDELCVVRMHCWLLQSEELMLRDFEIAGLYGRERSTVCIGLKSVRNRMSTETMLRQRLDAVAVNVRAALKDFDGHRA